MRGRIPRAALIAPTATSVKTAAICSIKKSSGAIQISAVTYNWNGTVLNIQIVRFSNLGEDRGSYLVGVDAAVDEELS